MRPSYACENLYSCTVLDEQSEFTFTFLQKSTDYISRMASTRGGGLGWSRTSAILFRTCYCNLSKFCCSMNSFSSCMANSNKYSDDFTYSQVFHFVQYPNCCTRAMLTIYDKETMVHFLDFGFLV